MQVDDGFSAKVNGVLEMTRGALIYDCCSKVITSSTGQSRCSAKDVSEGFCERCGTVSESTPKLKVTGVVRDRKGVEVRIFFFGEVAEKVVLMNAEECVVWVEWGAVRLGVCIRIRQTKKHNCWDLDSLHGITCKT